MSQNQGRTENFREHLGNVTDTGKRIWLYPKIIKGKWYQYRNRFSWLLLALLFAGPFIRISGKPMLLLNVLERKFIIFGSPFWPQDFPVFAFGLVTFIIFVVLFTVVFGRVWCGWACPQTIFMEMVFRKIENLIEGNSIKQRKLDEMPWNAEKVLKKGSKHLVFFFISFLIANTFLAYIIGSDQLIKIITEPVTMHIAGFISILVFSLVFYLVFAKLREIVCIIICPYGRLQGVMLDPNSVVVAYDYKRGEPRGKIKKTEDQSAKGDCVDCDLCVDVCPTGIDIRNGTQLECINCTACIDACNEVMVKTKQPQGLIRFDSVNNIEKQTGFKWTWRMKSYSILLGVLTIALIWILISRSDIDATILRSPGSNFNKDQQGIVANIYSLELVNKTFVPVKYDLKVQANKAEIIFIDKDKVVPEGEVVQRAFLLKIPADNIVRNNTKIKLDLYTNGKLLNTFETSFLGPVKRKP
jgi:cytochrome c oxidase accessory protein FixG